MMMINMMSLCCRCGRYIVFTIRIIDGVDLRRRGRMMG